MNAGSLAFPHITLPNLGILPIRITMFVHDRASNRLSVVKRNTASRWCALLTALIASTSGCGESSKKDGPSDPDSILAEVRGASNEESGSQGDASKARIDEILKEQLANGDSGFRLPTSAESADSNSRAILQLENIQKDEPLRPAVSDDPSGFWFTDPDKPLELWELIFVGNDPIGYASRRSSLISSTGSDLVRNEVESTTRVVRAGQPAKQTIKMTSIEKRNGELNHLSMTVESGRHRREINASISDGKLTVMGVVDGISVKSEYAWAATDRGPFAIEQSLLRKPIRESEIRLIRFFDPIINKVVDSRLESKDRYASPTMLSNAPMLREIVCEISEGQKKGNSTLWMDDNGAVLKTYLPDMDVRVFRVDSSTALAFSRILNLKTVATTTCPLELKNIDRVQVREMLAQSASMAYQLEHLSKDPYSFVPKDPFQRVISSDARTLVVTRKSVAEVDQTKAESVSNLAGQSTDWINFESDEFLRWKKELVLDVEATDSNTLSRVKDFGLAIAKKYNAIPFDRQVRRTSELFSQTAANCAEQSLLMIALCRHDKIPARVAIGYVVDLESEQPQMVLHAWVEFWSNGQWRAADAFLRGASTYLDRIKMRVSYGEDPKLLDDFAEVAQWMSEIKIRIAPPRQ